MKLRKGFVSNSSSSSFLIYGVYDPKLPEDIAELADKDVVKKAWTVWYQERLDSDYGKKSPELYPKDETFETWLKKKKESLGGDIEYFVFSEVLGMLGFEHHAPEYSGNYLGICPTNMGDDETMGQFKDRVQTALEEIFGEVSCSWQEYAWRNG